MNGWINIDKPAGITSAKVVALVRHILKIKKIGHAGTLDPFATGVLPLAVGEATKTIQFLQDRDKDYECIIRWGVATTTDDLEGEILHTSDRRPTAVDIKAAVPNFTGKITQMPPQFSALKINGQRAYKLARAHQHADLKARPINVAAFEVVETVDADHAKCRITCGKGTYIRALARDLGEMLGCYGHLVQLRRTRVGQFTEKNAISLDFLEETVHKGAPEEVLLDVETSLDDIPAISINGAEAARLRQGQVIPLNPGSLKEGDVVYTKVEHTLIAFCRKNGATLKPIRVFNL